MLILGLLIISVWDETYLCDRQTAGRGVIVAQAVQHLSAASAIDLHTGTQGWCHILCLEQNVRPEPVTAVRLGWFKQFLLMKACQITITQYLGGGASSK